MTGLPSGLPQPGGMALERAHVWRKQAEADRAAAVAVIDAVDQRRELLAPVIVGREQVRLMLAGGHQVEQHDADAQRLVPRDLQAISSIEHTFSTGRQVSTAFRIRS